MKLYMVTDTEPPFLKRNARRAWFKATQKTMVYDAVDGSGAGGITANDVARQTNVIIDRVRFYLSELRRSGHIAVKGDPTTVSATMNADEAAFAALLGLENALVARARESGITPELEKAFAKYSKIKELALRPGVKAEGQVALKMAILELVRAVF